MFIKRLAEECLYAFVGAVSGALLTGELDKAALLAAGVVGVRAVLGVIVKNFGADKDKPSITA